MKAALCVLALVAVAFALSEKDYQAEFGKFVAAHNRTYANGEKAIRFAIFSDNLDRINAHNADKTQTYTMAMNQFGDLTKHEFKAQMNGYTPRAAGYKSEKVHVETTPVGDVNWIQKGAVTNVKNQQQCGSCWAFSACAGLEGAFQLAGNPLTSFAPQELVDCDKVDNGCNGGLMDNAFNYIKQNGICTWDSYKYTGQDGSCKSSQCKAVGHVSGHTDVSASASALQSAADKQPISIAVDAEPWQFYSGGIFSSNCGTQLDHGVLLAGYTSSYWLVKNSWGTSWGESGYIRLSATVSNQCGLENAASYPSV